jgi:hypothetical protein
LGDKQSVSKEQRKDDTLGLKWKQELWWIQFYM